VWTRAETAASPKSSVDETILKTMLLVVARDLDTEGGQLLDRLKNHERVGKPITVTLYVFEPGVLPA
jgi:hypothetical protein